MDSHLPPLLAAAFDLRLVSREQVIRLADRAIAESDRPPGWLIELSCAPDELSPYDFGRLLPRTNEPADEEFLALLAYGWKQSLLDQRRIGSLLCNRFCFIEWKEMTPLREAIYLHDDELARDAGRAGGILSGILEPYTSAGEVFMDAINAPDT